MASSAGRNVKQKQLSQEDMFEDDIESSQEHEKQSIKFKNKLSIQDVPFPAVAVPEKVVFCIDATLDSTNGYLFQLADSEQPPSINSIRNEAIRVFIANKLSIARHTEFALVKLLPGKAELVIPLSSNVGQFMNCLTDLQVSPVSEAEGFDITSAFDSVLSVVDIPLEPKLTTDPPHYLIRLIMIYSNSFLEPTVDFSNECYNKFSMSPFCALDVIYLHDKPSNTNNVEQVFKCFGKIVLANSYLLENARNVTTLFNKMAKLLAHPYQRVPQELWQF